MNLPHSHRLLRHVRHKRLGSPQATRTPKRTEPAVTVGQILQNPHYQNLYRHQLKNSLIRDETN